MTNDRSKRFLLKSRQWDSMRRSLEEAGRGQRIWMEFRQRIHPGEPIAEADALCTELGLKAQGERWSLLQTHAAEAVLHRMVGRSLLMDYWLMEPLEARALTEHVVETFEFPGEFLTTVIAFDEQGITAWDPVTEMPVDTCLVLMDRDWVGLIAVGEAN